jgi:hypothetical protein
MNAAHAMAVTVKTESTVFSHENGALGFLVFFRRTIAI